MNTIELINKEIATVKGQIKQHEMIGEVYEDLWEVAAKDNNENYMVFAQLQARNTLLKLNLKVTLENLKEQRELLKKV